MSDKKNLEINSEKLNEVSGGESIAQEPIDKESVKPLIPHRLLEDADHPDRPQHLVATDYGFPEPRFKKIYPQEKTEFPDDASL